MRLLQYILLVFMVNAFAAANAQTNKTPERYEPKAVDLGLPSGTLWADRNMGNTEKPGEPGEYYCWGGVLSHGEMNSYDEYYQRLMTSWRGYRFGTGPKALSKYCTDSTFGKVDGKTQLDPEDDAATSYAKNHQIPTWDARWHIPTHQEFAELMEKCKWTWTNGGYQVTGPNGKSIFLPAAGKNGDNGDNNDLGIYWTSNLCPEFPCYAYSVVFSDEFISWNNGFRFSGYSIRPVRNKK